MLQITIPGMKPSDPPATATIREPDEVTERHRRPLKALTMRIPQRKLEAALASEDDTVAGLSDPSVALTQDEAEAFLQFGDAVILAVLADWTLPIPVPRTLDGVQDMPGAVYESLSEQTAEVGAALLGSPGATVTETGDGTGGAHRVIESVALPADNLPTVPVPGPAPASHAPAAGGQGYAPPPTPDSLPRPVTGPLETVDPFGPDGIGDKGSPTGASDA